MKHNDLLINAIEVLALDANGKKEYLNRLFDGQYSNLDELLLEYDDAKFLKEYYNEDVRKTLIELDEILDKIDEFKLHSIDDLNHKLWNEVREKAIKVLKYLNVNGCFTK